MCLSVHLVSDFQRTQEKIYTALKDYFCCTLDATLKYSITELNPKVKWGCASGAEVSVRLLQKQIIAFEPAGDSASNPQVQIYIAQS